MSDGTHLTHQVVVMANPVQIKCLGGYQAQRLATYCHNYGATATVAGDVVTVPGDQPGWLFGVLGYAESWNLASDGALAETIEQMSARLGR